MKFAIGMLTCHVDGQGYVEKHFFGCVARKLKQEIKFLTATLRLFFIVCCFMSSIHIAVRHKI